MERGFSVSGFDVAIGQAWDAAGISLEALILPDVHVDDVYVEPCFAWEKQRILIVDALDADVQNIFLSSRTQCILCWNIESNGVLRPTLT